MLCVNEHRHACQRPLCVSEHRHVCFGSVDMTASVLTTLTKFKIDEAKVGVFVSFVESTGHDKQTAGSVAALSAMLYHSMCCVCVCMQGSHRSWNPGKVLEFEMKNSRPGILKF